MVSRSTQPRRGAQPPRAEPTRAASTYRTFVLVGCVWLELGAVQWACPGDGGVACSFVGALALTLGFAPRPSEAAAHTARTRPARARWRAGLEWLCWGGLGVALQPWLAGLAVAAASAIASEVAIPRSPPETSLWRVASICVLAPTFEEVLYRGRLFDALARTGSARRAVIVTAVFFALPHAGRLGVFAVFLAGLTLGAARSATGRLAPCIALHAGFNVSALRDALYADFNVGALRDALSSCASA